MYAERVAATIPYASGGLPRSSGVHVSGLIRKMAAQYGILSKKWVPDWEELSLIEVEGDGAKWWDTLDEDSKVRMGIGMAWEQWYLPQLPFVTHQPGEIRLEGIYMTLDGESLDTVLSERGPSKHILAVHEVKTTSKSINTVDDFRDPNSNSTWMWLMQTKAYCKAVNSRVCYLHILYLYGDYSYPMRPQLHVWRIEFEQWEINDAWSLIVDYLRQHLPSSLRVR